MSYLDLNDLSHQIEDSSIEFTITSTQNKSKVLLK